MERDVFSSFKIKILQKLGGGGQGKVYHCEIEGEEGFFATKVREAFIDDKEKSLEMLRETYLELIMTKHLDHPNIAKHMYAVKESTQEKDKYHLVLEFINGTNLSTHILTKVKQGSSVDISEVSMIGR